MDWPLRFGIFMAPFHPVGQNPTLALERDLDLVVHLDKIGFHEAWFGEHHSAGYEIIASPELFIATAAERTRHIRLGTGVVSLPYHHPFMVAQRIVQLDHLTRGRVMLGVGPGALPSDAFMLGIDPAVQRDRMEESLEVILELLRTDEPVTRETEWFTLRDARLHLRPYTQPHPEVAVAAMISPSGPRAAGKYGCSLLSIGATQRAGIDLLGQNWQVMEDRCAEFGTVADRQAWRLVSQVHIAETKEQAYRDVEYGLHQYIDYFRRVAALPMVPEGSDEHPAELLNQTGAGVIGTPDDLIEFIEHLAEQSGGGFGTFLVQAHEWADPHATHRSYELIAQHVMPHFDGSAQRPTASRDWVAENRPQFMGAAGGAIMAAIAKHHDEQAAKNG
ncbi:MAG: LLM class flavin-dependent oxidoreductase [Acidimicrobiales bacterium]|nr:LLM class flavin-dependent oxidoreductase [Acidimicrobiales bacterium]MCB1249889.1 LLM class flavin-dependent oxidoreductase [Acidimicrobiales bacterium]MCB1259469.1 LLM class flavin-dependent oxidoreductase [Acidimicrobiales bacterium]